VRAVFYGLGADGTVGANKNTAKIIGGNTDLHVQAYFVYDSKKSGSTTVSHVRVDEHPINSTYLIDQATFVGVHQWNFFERLDVLRVAAPGATVLLNSPYPADQIWDRLPAEVQEQMHRSRPAAVRGQRRHRGARGRAGWPHQHRHAGVLLRVGRCAAHRRGAARAEGGHQEELRRSGRSGGRAQRRRGRQERSRTCTVPVGAAVTSTVFRRPAVSADAPDFVQRVTARMLSGEGDLLPVSALPADGAFVTGTSQYEKRTIAAEIPIWEPDLCIDCGKCAIVCPHAAIRMKVYDPTALADVDDLVKTKSFRSREVPGMQLTIQVAPDDCTGCGVCVQACPAHDKSEVKRKSINMRPIAEHLDRERVSWDAFLAARVGRPLAVGPCLGEDQPAAQPLFEFSGACAGCGETPYLKLLTQLFGDHLLIANATGCSSIFGGNLPTTPYAVNADGRGPAWANSLFEDNAEFGLGIRLGFEAQRRTALVLVERMRVPTGGRAGRRAARRAGGRRRRRRRARHPHTARAGGAPPCSARRAHRPRRGGAAELADTLVRKSVWIVGGDGWAYDIGAGGLDHVLGSGRNVNILVLDTEVYSNTGGQASKATPRGAVAKFAAGGKGIGMKKDLGLEAMSYGDVYVAKHRARLQRRADREGSAGSRRLAGRLAGHRLQHLHRPRLRHEPVDDPAEAGRAERSLAAVPLPPGPTAMRSRSSSTAPTRRCRTPTSLAARPGSRCWPAANPDRARRAGGPGPGRTSTIAGTTTASWPTCTECRPATPPTPPSPMRRTSDDRPVHHLPRAAAAQPVRGLRRPAHGRTRRCGSGCEDAGAGAIVLPSLFEEEIEHEAFTIERAPTTTPPPVR
jgi:pyruvate-ferredoxin/flavodoxin oxidoreductase